MNKPAEGNEFLFPVLVKQMTDPQPSHLPRQDHQKKQCRLTEGLKLEHYSATRSRYLPIDCEDLPCQSVLEQGSASPKPPLVPGGPQFTCEGFKFSLQRMSGVSADAFGLNSLMFRPPLRHKTLWWQMTGLPLPLSMWHSSP